MLRRIRYDLKRNRILLLMLLPASAFFVLFYYLPMSGIVLAFKDFRSNLGIFGSPWVGLKNFEYLIRSDTLLRLTRNTVLYNVAFMVVNHTLMIAAAIFLSEVGRKAFRKLSQSLIFLPYFISFVLVAVFAYNLLSQRGIINTALVSLGLERIPFYSTPEVWPIILIVFNAWKTIGYGTVIYLAAIAGIDPTLYSAARIDGAGVFKQVRYITLPLLLPTLVILLLLEIGQILRGQFQLFYQLVGQNGLLFGTTDIIDTYVFRVLVGSSASIGMGAAVGLYQSFFGLILVVAVNKLVKSLDSELSLF
jgi:putative aldouronate transport system permease protein